MRTTQKKSPRPAGKNRPNTPPPRGGRRLKKPRATPLSTLPFGLTPLQYTFALTWASNGFNGASAYRAASPTVSLATASVNGSRMLAIAKVRAFLASLLGDRWKAEQMNGEEALGRVARDARADLRMLYDAKGELLPVHQWPDEIAGSVKSLAERADGTVKITLVDSLTARRIILEQTGKLKTPLEGAFDALADAIRADVARTQKP